MRFQVCLHLGEIGVKEKGKRVLAVVIIVGFMLGIAQLFVPSVAGQTSSLTINNSYWLRLATNAWNYFQPGVGVDATTGLHGAGLSWPYFTDWDLACYIQAVIDANQLGILGESGAWGATARVDDILSFLETRTLTSSGVPYVLYQSANGDPSGSAVQDAFDAGALLVALNNLRIYKPDLAGTINYIVYNRTNYAPLEQQAASFSSLFSLYDYYAVSGFACFWPSQFSSEVNTILNTILSGPTVSTYGVQLPEVSELTCDSLFLSIFNLSPSDKLDSLAQLVYSADLNRYEATGNFGAFSEGNTGLSNPDYVYEFVVDGGSTWVVDDTSFNSVGSSPITFFKSAVDLLAMFDSSYAESMASYVESELPSPTHGYSEGVDESGRVASDTDSNSNSLIIQAAKYAINSSPSPSPTPTPTPTSTPVPSKSPTVAPTQSPTPTPSQSPTPITTVSASPTVPEFPAQLVGITLLISMIVVLSVVIIVKKRTVWKIRDG